MEDRLTMIRRQMDLTKRDFELKLASLEQQVTEKVHSAGTAVNATAEAVQDVVHSVSDAFDVPRQFDRHPWLFLGSSVVLGYVVTDVLYSNSQNAPCCPARDSGISSPGSSAAGSNGTTAGSSGTELRRAFMGMITGLAQELIAQAVPQVVNLIRQDRPAEQPSTERRADSVKPENV
jgi:hypothetical protein